MAATPIYIQDISGSGPHFFGDPTKCKRLYLRKLWYTNRENLNDHSVLVYTPGISSSNDPNNCNEVLGEYLISPSAGVTGNSFYIEENFYNISGGFGIVSLSETDFDTGTDCITSNVSNSVLLTQSPLISGESGGRIFTSDEDDIIGYYGSNFIHKIPFSEIITDGHFESIEVTNTCNSNSDVTLIADFTAINYNKTGSYHTLLYDLEVITGSNLILDRAFIPSATKSISSGDILDDENNVIGSYIEEHIIPSIIEVNMSGSSEYGVGFIIIPSSIYESEISGSGVILDLDFLKQNAYTFDNFLSNGRRDLYLLRDNLYDPETFIYTTLEETIVNPFGPNEVNTFDDFPLNEEEFNEEEIIEIEHNADGNDFEDIDGDDEEDPIDCNEIDGPVITGLSMSNMGESPTNRYLIKLNFHLDERVSVKSVDSEITIEDENQVNVSKIKTPKIEESGPAPEGRKGYTLTTEITSSCKGKVNVKLEFTITDSCDKSATFSKTFNNFAKCCPYED